MVMRVATFAVSEQMIAASLRSQGVMVQQQLQEAAGVTSTTFGGLGATSQQVVNLQISVQRSQAYIAAADATDNKVQVMYSTINSITNLLTQFRSTLTAASNSAAVAPDSVTASAQQALQSMQSLLNTQYAGSYIFSGARTATAPVNISNPPYAPASSPSSPDTSYYQGDDQIASVRVSDTQTVSYGINADNPAFEQAMRAFNLVASNSPLSSDTLTEALDLTVSALNDITTVQTNLGSASAALQAASASQSDYQSFAQSLEGNLTGVDVASVTAKLSTYQTQLQASYAAIAKIQSLSLASYLH